MAQDSAGKRADLLLIAEKAVGDGDLTLAREILESLLAAAPNDTDLLRRAANVEAASGNYTAALAYIDQASRLAPDDLDIALARANIHFWNEDIATSRIIAGEIAEQAADYPDLDKLQSRLAQWRNPDRVRLTAFAVSTGLSDIAFTGRQSEAWSEQAAALGIAVSRDLTMTLTAEREARDVADERFSLRGDLRLDGGAIYLSAAITPDANFRENWSISAGGETALARSTAILFDLRYAEYANSRILSVQPGLRFYAFPKVTVSGRAITLLGGGGDLRIGGAIRLEYGGEDKARLFAGAASYPDIEADGVRQLRSGTFGIAVPVGNTLSITASTNYENRKNSYRRISAVLAFSIRFDAK